MHRKIITQLDANETQNEAVYFLLLVGAASLPGFPKVEFVKIPQSEKIKENHKITKHKNTLPLVLIVRRFVVRVQNDNIARAFDRKRKGIFYGEIP